MKLLRFIKAKIYGVPFRKKMWYNFMAMLSEETRKSHSYIIIFDENNDYIDCPEISGMVKVHHSGKIYQYKVVGFKNESRNRDWLYGTDYINPIVEFVKPL